TWARAADESDSSIPSAGRRGKDLRVGRMGYLLWERWRIIPPAPSSGTIAEPYEPEAGMSEATAPGRRDFLTRVVGGAVAAAFARPTSAAEPPARRRMTIDLICGNLGVKATQREAIDLAHRHGFESVFPDAAELARLSDAETADLLAELKAKGLVFGAAFLAVDFRKDDATFERGLAELPGYARTLERAGVRRTGTWLPPSSDTLTYLQYFKQTARRLREVAR